MRVIVGNDHGAIELKQRIVGYLKNRNIEVVNRGVDEQQSVDYPDIAADVCEEYKKGGYDFGILFCGTGIGISISANKIDGIRCALPSNLFAAEMAKAHNDANFIAFGGRMTYMNTVEEMIGKFIDTEYEGGRHQRRVDKMMSL